MSHDKESLVQEQEILKEKEERLKESGKRIDEQLLKFKHGEQEINEEDYKRDRLRETEDMKLVMEELKYVKASIAKIEYKIRYWHGSQVDAKEDEY